MPERLFITSPFEDFDYTFVWIESAAAEQFGTIQMTRGSFLIRQTEPTFILHHPDGSPQKASVDDTELLSVNSSFLLYAADTEGGSSGSPVFNKHGQLTGLHHAWWPIQTLKSEFPNLTGRLNNGNFTGHANEGIKLAAIAIDLERHIASGNEKARDAATVLQAFDGSDTLTGMFGSLGRDRGDETAPAYEKVVTVYQGREQDIDIGAWNIEWLNRDHANDNRMHRV
ncbi:MAG: trypsin-like peptidase domain-containing protein, partial [Planctomycetota bacterium]